MSRDPDQKSNERGFLNLFHAAHEMEKEQQAEKQQEKGSTGKELNEREEGR